MMFNWGVFAGGFFGGLLVLAAIAVSQGGAPNALAIGIVVVVPIIMGFLLPARR